MTTGRSEKKQSLSQEVITKYVYKLYAAKKSKAEVIEAIKNLEESSLREKLDETLDEMVKKGEVSLEQYEELDKIFEDERLEYNFHDLKKLLAKVLHIPLYRDGVCFGSAWVDSLLVLANRPEDIFKYHYQIVKLTKPLHLKMKSEQIKELDDKRIKEDLLAIASNTSDELRSIMELTIKLTDVTHSGNPELKNQDDVYKLLPNLNIYSLKEEKQLDDKNIAVCKSFTVSYREKTQLIEIFDHLRTSLDELNCAEPFSLLLNTEKHVVMLSYINHKWIFSDINDRPLIIDNTVTLAQNIDYAFILLPYAFNIKMISKKIDEATMRKLFIAWQEKCGRKAIQGNLEETLNCAVIHRDFKTIQTLIQEFRAPVSIDVVKLAICSYQMDAAILLYKNMQEVDNKQIVELFYMALLTSVETAIALYSCSSEANKRMIADDIDLTVIFDECEKNNKLDIFDKLLEVMGKNIIDILLIKAMLSKNDSVDKILKRYSDKININSLIDIERTALKSYVNHWSKDKSILYWVTTVSYVNNIEIINALIKHGADPFFMSEQKDQESNANDICEGFNNRWETPFDNAVRLAIRNNNWKTVEIMAKPKDIDQKEIIRANDKINAFDTFVYQKNNKQLSIEYMKLKKELKLKREFYTDRGIEKLDTIIHDFSKPTLHQSDISQAFFQQSILLKPETQGTNIHKCSIS